ncbi:MAG: hypothetical protein E5V96_13050 [Mesorhizobium sp.]|nr:MAG: hypothetical protein E5V96_13050 [Mesorhizobium sp.]
MSKQTNRFSQHRKNSIHAIIREKTDLARIYAEDGAFHTAARVLEDLATVVSRHAVVTTPRDLDDPMPCRVGDLMDSDYARDVMKIELVATLELTEIHIRLLKRGSTSKWIGLSDNAGIHDGEVCALGELERAGLVRATEDKLPPGPPSMKPYEITDAGRAALAKSEAMPTLDREWLKRKIAEDGEEGEIGAGFEMFPLPSQAREG